MSPNERTAAYPMAPPRSALFGPAVLTGSKNHASETIAARKSHAASVLLLCNRAAKPLAKDPSPRPLIRLAPTCSRTANKLFSDELPTVGRS